MIIWKFYQIKRKSALNNDTNWIFQMYTHVNTVHNNAEITNVGKIIVCQSEVVHPLIWITTE